MARERMGGAVAAVDIERCLLGKLEDQECVFAVIPVEEVCAEGLIEVERPGVFSGFDLEELVAQAESQSGE